MGLRSQAAKAVDCKSATPGSNPGGASSIAQACSYASLGDFVYRQKEGSVERS